MALEFIATLGATIKVTSPSTTANCVITSLPSTKVKPSGSFVFRGPISISCSNGVQGVCGTSTPATGTGTINPTASKVKSDGQFVIRKGDGATIVMNGTQPNPPGPPIACVFNMDVEIDDPNNAKVRAQ